MQFSDGGTHGHFGALLAEMNDAGLGTEYRTQAMNIASYITYHLRPDNGIAVGEEWPPIETWYSCHFGAVGICWRFLAISPKRLPTVKPTCCARTPPCGRFRYEASKVAYTTDRESTDTAKLAFQPARVTLNGQPLPAGNGRTNGWNFDSAAKVLRVAHGPGAVVISGL